KEGLPKFNEEAHILSYLYYKNNFNGGGGNLFIKRIWTNPVFMRNVDKSDVFLSIWHLPAEKTIGFKQLFNFFRGNSFKTQNMGELLPAILRKELGIPHLTFTHHIKYYTITYFNAINKRIKG